MMMERSPTLTVPCLGSSSTKKSGPSKSRLCKAGLPVVLSQPLGSQKLFFFQPLSRKMSAFYKSSRGRLWHSHPSCTSLRRAASTLATGRPPFCASLCTRCFAPCLVCQTAGGHPIGCDASHSICDDCLKDCIQGNGAPTNLSCPCGGGGELPLHSEHVRTWIQMLTCEHKNEGGDNVEADILTDRCPECGAAFYDFDACLALVCHRCKSVFCALCDATCDSMTDGHAHVAACTMNPNRPSYYMNFSDWQALRFEQKTRAAVNHVVCVFQEHGFLSSLASASRLRRQGVPIVLEFAQLCKRRIVDNSVRVWPYCAIAGAVVAVACLKTLHARSHNG